MLEGAHLPNIESTGKGFDAKGVVKYMEQITKDNSQLLPPGLPAWVFQHTIDVLEKKKEWDSDRWLRMVDFLARIVRARPQSGKDWTFRIDDVDNSVIDSLFYFLIRARRPSTGHRILAHLTRAWRCRLLLTTNFDSLIEQAFDDARETLLPIEIGVHSTLPSASVVLSNRTLLKLHGGKLGLRADWSINQPLRGSEAQFLLACVGGDYRRDRNGFHASEDARVAIVVSGVSASDERCQSVIRTLWTHFSHIHLYWISFERHPTFLDKLSPPNTPGGRELFRLSHSNHGLLFQQIQQRITGTLAPAGVTYPGLWQIPAPPRLPRPARDTGHIDREVQEIHDAVKAINETLGDQRSPNFLIIHPKDGTNRASFTVCSHLRWETPGHDAVRRRYVWLDAERIAAPIGIMARLMLRLAHQQGESEPAIIPDLLAYQEDYKGGENYIATQSRAGAFFENIRNLVSRSFRLSGVPLVLIINAQEGLGKYAPFKLSGDLEKTGWDNLNANLHLFRNIVDLAQDPSNGIHVLLLKRDETKVPNLYPPEFISALQIFRKRKPPACEAHAIRYKTDWTPETTIKLAESFTSSCAADCAVNGVPETATQEICHLVLFVLAKSRSLIFECGIAKIAADYYKIKHPKIDSGISYEKISETVHRSIMRLAEHRILRFKDGGIIWLNREVAAGIEAFLTEQCQKDADAGAADYLLRCSLMARWQGRMLLSTEDPVAALDGCSYALTALTCAMPWIRNDETWGLVRVMISHAGLILDAARYLLSKRLASQYIDQYLMDLQGDAAAALQWFATSAEKQSSKSQTGVQQTLRDLLIKIVRLHSRIALREGDYATVKQRAETGWLKDINIDLPAHEEHYLRTNAAAALLHQRCYKESAKELRCLWVAVHLPEELCPSMQNWNHVPAIRKSGWGAIEARKWLAVHSPRADGAVAVTFVARLARLWLYWLLNYSQVLRMRGGAGMNQARLDFLYWGLEFYEFGLEILRGSPDTADRAVFEESIRLRAHGALSLAIIETQPSQGAADPVARRARSMLDDATSFMGDFPLHDAGIAGSIARLRLAEVGLLEAGNTTWFRTFRSKLREWKPQKKKSPPEKLPVNAGIQPVLSLIARLHTVLENLDAACESLSSQPKARWWWWIYLVLKMKCVEYLYAVRIAHALLDHSGSPPLGVVPPSAVKYFRDELLTLILSKNPTDSFYLSRIAFSHVNTIRSVVYYRALRPSTTRGTYRGQWNREKDEELERICSLTTNALEAGEKQTIDKNVTAFVKKTLTYVRKSVRRILPAAEPEQS